MRLGRKVAANTIVQIAGRILGLAIMLVTINFIANRLIVDGSALKGYGQYSIVAAYISIIGSLADLGLYTLTVREITNKSAREAGRIIGNAIGFRLILLVAVLLMIGLIYPILPYDPVVKQGVVIGVVIAFSMLFNQIIVSVFQANLAISRVVIAETIGKLVVAGGTILVLLHGGGLMAVIWANLFGYAVMVLISYLFARSWATIEIGFDFKLWRETGGQFWSMAVITVLGLIHFKFDSIMLSFYKSASDVGLYAIAYKLLEIILIIPSIFATNLLPVMTAIVDEGRHDEFGTLVKNSASLLLAVALFISVLVFTFSSWLIIFITQPEFIAAANALRVLVLAVLFIFMSTLISQAIVSTRQQKRLLAGYLGVVALNILLNFYAIPRFSYVGAAWTTLITEAVLMTYTVVIAWREFGVRFDWPVLIRLGLASAVSLAVIWFSRTLLVGPLADFATHGKLWQTGQLGATAILAALVFAVAIRAAFIGSKTGLRSLVSLR